MKNTVELLEAMGMGSLDAYVTDFEDQFLASTKEYYARKSQEWVESDDAPAYLAKAEVALEAEAARVAHYLNGASEPKLLRVCEHEILELRETVLLEKEGSGCRALLANDRKADLARMYRLFGRVPNTPTHGYRPWPHWCEPTSSRWATTSLTGGRRDCPRAPRTRTKTRLRQGVVGIARQVLGGSQ